MTTLSSDTVRRIEDAAAALIGCGSLSNISPVMRAFRACQREQADDDIARADTRSGMRRWQRWPPWKASWRCYGWWWPNLTACCRTRKSKPHGVACQSAAIPD